MASTRSPLSHAQLQEFRRLHEAGEKRLAIAAHFGISESSMRRVAHRLGLRFRPMVKLTVEQVKEIRELATKGELTQREIASRYGVTWLMVHRIKTRKSWKHV